MGINESLYSGNDTVISVGIDELFRFSTKLMTVNGIYYNYSSTTSFNTIQVETADYKQQIFIGFEVLDSNGLRVTNIGVNGFIDLLSYDELASVYNGWMIDYFEFGEIPTNFLESDRITDIKGGYVSKNSYYNGYDGTYLAADNMFICEFKTNMDLILQPVMSSLGFSVTYKCIDVVTEVGYNMYSNYTKDKAEDKIVEYEYPDVLGYQAGQNYVCPFDTRYFSPIFYFDYFKTSAIPSGSKISGQTDTIYYVLEHSPHSNKITNSSSSTSGNITTTVTHYACDYCDYTNKITTTEEIDTGDTGGSGSDGSGSVCAHDVGVIYKTNDYRASSVGDQYGSNVSICNDGYHSVYCKKCKAFLRKEHHNWQYMGWGDCVTYPGWTVSCLCDSWSTDANYTGDPEHDTELDNHKELHEVIEEPTCTTYGRIWYVCDACHYDSRQFYGAGSIPPLGHDWGDWNTVENATCTEAGLQTHVCKTCGASQEETIPALGHDYSVEGGRVDATCTTDGYQEWICSRDNCDATNKVTLSAFGHSYVQISPNRYKCSTCGDITIGSRRDDFELW